MQHPLRWLLLGSLAVAAATAYWSVREIVAADEVIYMVGARNLVERGTLATNFYLPHSVVVQGVPHRDVHLPGYLFALAPFAAILGPVFPAAAALNLLLLPIVGALVWDVARRVGLDNSTAAAAAGLSLFVPPFPGYLYVVFPEYLVAMWMLLIVASALRATSTAAALAAGVVFGFGPMFRETLLFALPVPAVLLPRRLLLRVYLPAAAITAALVFVVLGRGRAVLPNRMFPGIVFEALASESPFRILTDAVAFATARNLQRLREADPWRISEDLLLVFMLAVAVIAVVGALKSTGLTRRVGLAVVASFVLLAAAVMVSYPLRASGRILTGIRMGMAWMPLLVIFAATLLPRPPMRRRLAGTLAAVVFVAIEVVHLRETREWKSDNVRQQGRFADFLVEHLDPYHPDRIVVRSNHAFVYGLRRFPVEVVWPLRSAEELAALEERLPFDFVVVPLAGPMEHVLNAANPRYELLDTGKTGRWRIWRRRY